MVRRSDFYLCMYFLERDNYTLGFAGDARLADVRGGADDRRRADGIKIHTKAY
jgi:hypothetical protein